VEREGKHTLLVNGVVMVRYKGRNNFGEFLIPLMALYETIRKKLTSSFEVRDGIFSP
jgi:hypothetical protein